MTFLADEVHAFGNAVMFFTRLRVPKTLRWSEALMQKAAAWYPLVGALVGTLGASVAWLSLRAFPPIVAALFSTIATMLVTGAFHEDGLADVCDAFWGGYTRERVLEIMKDSRVGTFGAGGLGMVLLTKVVLLEFVLSSNDWLARSSAVGALIVAHTVSRSASVSLLRLLSYVRANDSVGAKSKPMATKISVSRLLFALLTAVVPLVLFVDLRRVPAVIALCALSTVGLAVWFRKRIGGYTGDCLGAVQQLTEIVVLAVLAAQVSAWS
jgi:adenosylcobinamide-GDP ribazoletransferase